MLSESDSYHPSAIGHYTQAILEYSNDWTFPLNRATACLKLGKVLTQNTTNVKALFRRAQARKALRKLPEAEKDFEQGITHDAVNSVKKSSKAADLASSSTVTALSSQSSTTTSVTCIPAEPSDSRPLQALRNPKPFIKRPNTFETRSKPTQVASVGASSVLQATTRSLPHALQRTTATAMRKWSLRYRSRRLTRLLIGGL
ncbi:hypothetical protein F5880DRAFT_821258 [Lentinula raphanica]|nr:hypothetical protein F5880DRAFT_821258 [Lentinula raphanica]